MSLLKIFIASAFLSVVISSCKKDAEPPSPKTKTRSELLTEASWKLVEAYINTKTEGVWTTNDIYANMPDCQRDNLTTFSKADHKVNIDDGAVRCNTSEPQTVAYERWVLVSNTRIELTDILFEKSYEAAIIELSETTLHIRTTGIDESGAYFERTYKYERAK